jgi:hypothetical protein
MSSPFALLPSSARLTLINDLDLPLVFGETHATAEALFVKTAELWLIIMMIGRPRSVPLSLQRATFEKFPFDRL